MDIFEKVVALIKENVNDAQEITADTTFESLGIDSLDIVEMVMSLEEELDMQIELEEKLSTVGEFVKYIEAKKAEQSK